MNTGFIQPVITADNHVFGASGIDLPVIKVDGDWTKYVPVFESQLETTFDSDGCCVYGTLNAIETLENYLKGTKPNYSDRFTYNTVGITPPGSDPHIVATNIRGAGLVTESDLPSVTASLAEFMTPRPVTPDLRIKGQQWLGKQMLGHKWLWTDQPDAKTRIALITEALTKGTVCVSVTAWYQNDQGLYFSPTGLSNGHWTYVYKIDETGIYVFDSYNDALTHTNIKKLTLDHSIEVAKVYFFTQPTEQQNWLIELIVSMLELVGLLKKKPEIPLILKTDYQEVTKATPMKPTFTWTDLDINKHNVRVICDEEGLTFEQKETLCATVHGESGFDTTVTNKNYAFSKLTGKKYLASTDYGICQWNDYWHGKEITPYEAIHDPEKAIRLMCAYWKRGQMNQWVAYSSGRYKHFL